MIPPRPHCLVLTIHGHGWMAGCHCGAAFRMPPGLRDDPARAVAAKLYATHLEETADDGRRPPS